MINSELKVITYSYMRKKLEKITCYFSYLTCEGVFTDLMTYNTPLEIFNKPIDEKIRDLGI